MLRMRGDGIQDNWHMWINGSVFSYDTTVSINTGETLH